MPNVGHEEQLQQFYKFCLTNIVICQLPKRYEEGKKGIPKCLSIFTWQKNSIGFRDQQRSIRLSVWYKSARMQNVKPIPGINIKKGVKFTNLLLMLNPIVKLAINVKPNCQTVG